MIFKYKGYGYRLRQNGQAYLYYKIKRLKWHWYNRAEALDHSYEGSPIQWKCVKREDNEVTEEFIRRTHTSAQDRIDGFRARDEELLKMKELLHEPNIEFMNRIMK